VFAKTNFVQGKLKNILNMMLPIFITQAAIMSMGVADTIMSGHAGVAQLAGVAIANNIWMPIFTGLNGILMALTPIVAHLLGAGKKDALGTSFWNGLYLSLFISAGVIFAGYLFLDSILTALILSLLFMR
jgi:MATE family multidrug resistance protein